jgi:hypothetical protein
MPTTTTIITILIIMKIIIPDQKTKNLTKTTSNIE